MTEAIDAAPVKGTIVELDVRSLVELVYQSVKEAILTGALPPGSDLRQERLAKQFGVSRVPIREAMSRLVADGLVVLRPRRGFVVSALTLSEIEELCELSLVIDEHAAIVATRARTSDDVLEVEDLLRTMEALDPAEEGFLSRWQDVNGHFHARLFASSRRDQLNEIVLKVRQSIERYMRIERDLMEHIAESRREHEALFDAFRRGDTEAAGRLSREHSQTIARYLITNLRSAGT